MLGYLNDPNKTNEVIKDGWYHTGDIAKLDDYGFITITDRLSRFSKIGGEMVAHIARASGERGRCSDYLARTVQELQRLGIRDAGLESLEASVSARLRTGS